MPLDRGGECTDDRYPYLFTTMASFGDPPIGMSPSQGFAFEVETGQTGGARSLAELDAFLATDPSEQACAALLEDFAGDYDVLAEFPSNRACWLWIHDRLREGVAKRPHLSG
jgi:hypothetical protein